MVADGMPFSVQKNGFLILNFRAADRMINIFFVGSSNLLFEGWECYDSQVCIKTEKIMDNRKNQSIAIVGMAFRLPGNLSTSDALWNALITGENLISEIDNTR